LRAVVLVVAAVMGAVVLGFGALIWAAIPRSDTATSVLAAWVLLRRGRP
jgi:hypothetical protein